MFNQGINWRAHALVEKWDEDATKWVAGRAGLLEPKASHFKALKVKPYEVTERPNNLLTTAGLTRISNLIIGTGSTQAATQTATRIGVGDGSTTAVIGDTDLSAAAGGTHRQFNILDSAPSVSGGVMTFISTFTSGLANFTWSEWGIDIGTPTVSAGTTVSAVLLNHKSSAALGTKSSGSWAFTATVTLS